MLAAPGGSWPCRVCRMIGSPTCAWVGDIELVFGEMPCVLDLQADTLHTLSVLGVIDMSSVLVTNGRCCLIGPGHQGCHWPRAPRMSLAQGTMRGVSAFPRPVSLKIAARRPFAWKRQLPCGLKMASDIGWGQRRGASVCGKM
jgi:hypothetical protein